MRLEGEQSGKGDTERTFLARVCMHDGSGSDMEVNTKFVRGSRSSLGNIDWIANNQSNKIGGRTARSKFQTQNHTDIL